MAAETAPKGGSTDIPDPAAQAKLPPLEFRPPAEYKKWDVLIPREHIYERVRQLANEIAEKYRGRRLLLVPALQGAMPFAVALQNELYALGLEDIEQHTIEVNSYSKTESTGRVRMLKAPDPEVVDGRETLIIEDIVDTGLSLDMEIQLLKDAGAKSIESVALLSKQSRRKVQINSDYLGWEIDDHFVVGYGLDYEQQYRFHPDIVVFEPPKVETPQEQVLIAT